MKKIIIKTHEGVISDSITIIACRGKDRITICLKNEIASWKYLKDALDSGIKVVVEREFWNGKVERTDWLNSPSYAYRFGNQAVR